MNNWAAAGGNAVVIPVIWAAAQPNEPAVRSTSPRPATTANNVLIEIDQAAAAHLQVYLEISIHIRPTGS